MALADALAKNKFTATRADFYVDLASALEDKSDLVSEFTNLRARAEKRKQQGFVNLFSRWLRGLDNGRLTDALKEDVPKSDIMILGAFEEAGRLADGLKFLAKTVNLASRMRSAIQGAMIAPAFVLVMIGGILALHAFLLTPVLEQIIPLEEWPFVGQILHPVAMFVKNYGLFIPVVIAALAISFKLSLTRWTGPKRVAFDNHLPYSIFRDYNGALFLTSLSALMKAGNGVMESLKQLQSLSTPWMKWHITQMLARLDANASQPAVALDTGAMPREIMDRIIDYGKRQSFLEAMSVIGLESMERTEAKINKSAKVINTFMLVLVGVLFIIVIAGTVSTGLHASDVIRSKM